MNRKNIIFNSIIALGVIVIYFNVSTIIKYIKFNMRIIEEVDYVIELDKYNISNNNTNANDTTIGINKALQDAKDKGFKTVKLPKGHYAIDTSVVNPIILTDGNNEFTHNRKGIIMQSDMELIMTDVILKMIPTNDPYYSIFTISNCENSKITGGTILGDRYTHNYGLRINNSGDELESGSYDFNTGKPIDDDTKVRTKGFIDSFNGEPLPNEFILTVLEKTTKNTVDGGVRYIYCYDKDENYLGIAPGGNGFLSKATLLPNTAKIKISFKDEKRLDGIYYITKELIYPTHEFGAGITITDSNNIEINGTTVKDVIGDCVLTFGIPIKVTVDNVKFINCTFENARRQGISFVATGENYLIKGCNIGKINGTDPQCGIDIEHYGYVKNIVIDSSNFYDNKKWDIVNYNGQDIEIKNSKFTGGIASTFGWNMNIHNNEFEYRDTINNPKIWGGALIGFHTNKTDEDNAYFKFNNNIVKGYYGGGTTSSLRLSEFNNNKIYDTERLGIICNNPTGNIFENSKVSYNTLIIKDEVFRNSIISMENLKFESIIEGCVFDESIFRPGSKTTIRNSKITNNDKSFGDTTAWWDLNRKTIFENCEITTTYEDNTPFLSNYMSNTLFKNCNFSISRSMFSLNYGGIEFEECNFIFNDINKSEDIIDFDMMGYYNKTNYWKFTNCYFKSKLPVKINTQNLFNCIKEENVIFNSSIEG